MEMIALPIIGCADNNRYDSLRQEKESGSVIYQSSHLEMYKLGKWSHQSRDSRKAL